MNPLIFSTRLKKENDRDATKGGRFGYKKTENSEPSFYIHALFAEGVIFAPPSQKQL
jgi:hypothetical protein